MSYSDFESIRKNCKKRSYSDGKIFVYHDPYGFRDRYGSTVAGVEIQYEEGDFHFHSEYIARGYESMVTEKQKKYIKALSPSFPVEGVFRKEQASKIIEELKSLGLGERKPGMASVKQIALLKAKGFKGVENLTFQGASTLISKLSMNNFQPTEELYALAKNIIEGKHEEPPKKSRFIALPEEIGIELW